MHGVVHTAFTPTSTVLFLEKCAIEDGPTPPERRVLSLGDVDRPGRKFVVDSGATVHLISPKHLTKFELRSKRQAHPPMPLQTANGVVEAKFTAKAYVKDLDATLEFYLLSDAPPVVSLGELRLESNFRYI